MKARPNRRHRLLEVTGCAFRQLEPEPTASLDAFPAISETLFGEFRGEAWDEELASRLAKRLKEQSS